MEQTSAPKTKSSKGLVVAGIVGLILFVALVIIIAILTSFNKNQPSTNNQTNTTTQNTDTKTNNNSTKVNSDPSSVLWSQDGKEWKAMGSVPKCEDKITFDSPVDLELATNILYPGQTRGGDFKAHGGFILGKSDSNEVNVTLPMGANIYQGARYIEAGELQILLDFVTPCGIMFRYDHLAAVSSELQVFIDELPQPQKDDTRTTQFKNQKFFQADTLIATKVGFVNTNNKSFDFGVYDLRAKNEASKDTQWANQYSNKATQAFYGVCWLNYLTTEDKQIAIELPGPGTEGKTSVYCK